MRGAAARRQNPDPGAAIHDPVLQEVSAPVTVSIRRISLGGGYEYLIRSVARGDGSGASSSPLTRYYAESGTPPGRFLGAGLAGLDHGVGITAGTQVSEQALFRMLGMLADPVTGEPLGRAPRVWPKSLTQRVAERTAVLPPELEPERRALEVARIEAEETEREARLTRPVAGFDLTFSVSKSVSAAWAVADGATQAVIYQAHQDAIDIAIAHAERQVFFCRSGTNGIVQVPVRGIVAAAFDHWDSRAGDPHLHTHVTVLNRAQSADGTWRTLDSRTLFKYVVALSELHEGVVSDLLTERLGFAWDERARRHSSVPRHDVTGIPDALIAEFSQRAEQIETAKNGLIANFVARHGRLPTPVEMLRLRQRATLATRPDKQHRSLSAMTDAWRDRARPYIGADTVAWVATLRDRNDLPALTSGDLGDKILRDAASAALNTVADRRATFSHANVLAQVHRQLHGIHFNSPAERISVADRIVDHALDQALHLTAPDTVRTARIYTTPEILDAENRLLEAGRTTGAAGVPATIVEHVAAEKLPGRDHRLGPDQTAAVRAIATSGRALDLLVGPAGTGKTTSLAGLRAVWERQYGPGSVIGLAPSAAAAQVLADELGIDTENTAKWLIESARDDARAARIAELDNALAACSSPGSVRARRLATQRQILQNERQRWSLHRGQLLILDEASLSGTLTLDQIVTQAADAQAKVLLVGDWAQLSAIEAGGAFRMLVDDRGAQVAELTSVRRFANEWERDASTQLRIGDAAAIDQHDQHGRIHSGDRAQMLDAIYQAWRADTADGYTSIMIAADLETAADLNLRARTERLANAADDVCVDLADGTHAGVGDRIVTRQNDRRLAVGRRWVKNGDTWIVLAIHGDGSLNVEPEGGRGTAVLPAAYVAEHVELGYATTAYRAQGRTVDTAHVLVEPTTTREVLYVAATRGRLANHLYVDTCYDPDPDTGHELDSVRSAAVVLQSVLNCAGADESTHTVIARHVPPARPLINLSYAPSAPKSPATEVSATPIMEV
jgi:conjugative relaxase-like TrwC/TraI family protein